MVHVERRGQSIPGLVFMQKYNHSVGGRLAALACCVHIAFKLQPAAHLGCINRLSKASFASAAVHISSHQQLRRNLTMSLTCSTWHELSPKQWNQVAACCILLLLLILYCLADSHFFHKLARWRADDTTLPGNCGKRINWLPYMHIKVPAACMV